MATRWWSETLGKTLANLIIASAPNKSASSRSNGLRNARPFQMEDESFHLNNAIVRFFKSSRQLVLEVLDPLDLPPSEFLQELFMILINELRIIKSIVKQSLGESDELIQLPDLFKCSLEVLLEYQRQVEVCLSPTQGEEPPEARTNSQAGQHQLSSLISVMSKLIDELCQAIYSAHRTLRVVQSAYLKRSKMIRRPNVGIKMLSVTKPLESLHQAAIPPKIGGKLKIDFSANMKCIKSYLACEVIPCRNGIIAIEAYFLYSKITYERS
jgi:hypothetical protein